MTKMSRLSIRRVETVGLRYVSFEALAEENDIRVTSIDHHDLVTYQVRSEEALQCSTHALMIDSSWARPGVEKPEHIFVVPLGSIVEPHP